MKSPEAMANGRGVINLRFNQDQGLLTTLEMLHAAQRCIVLERHGSMIHFKDCCEGFLYRGRCDLPDYLIQTLTITTSGAFCESNIDLSAIQPRSRTVP